MATVGVHPQTAASPSVDGAAQVADVFVIFGITGDLAKVMTFHSLYRLEQRGLLTARSSAWRSATGRSTISATTRATRSRTAASTIDEEVFDRLRRAAVVRERRLRRRRPPTSASPRRSAMRGAPVFYLEIPPFLFGRVIKGLTEAGLTKNARVVVEKPFGHDLAVGAGAGGRDPPVHRRVAALPDRPLPREDGARGDPLPAVRERDVRADLEPQLRRQRRRSRWPRASASRIAATSTTRSGRCATWSSTT